MTHKILVVLVGAVISSGGLPPVRADSDPNTKIADLFEVRLDSARYTDSTRTTRTSEGRRKETIRRLRINCDVDIADANLVLGISERGITTQLTHGNGETLKIVEDRNQKLLRTPGIFQRYRGLRYRPQFVPPQKPAKWKTAIRSALRLPPPKRPQPQWSHKLEPSRVMLELNAGLLGEGTERISRIEGYLHVLMAESLEHIDIPFKSTEGWVRAAPGLEVKVVKAESSESGYKYSIDTRPAGDALKSQFTPGGDAFRGLLTPGADLPERLLVDQQFIDRNGKAAGPRPRRSLRLGAYGGGGGSGSSFGLIEKIRFVVAVNPSHQKIPFVLEDIPLPSLDAAAGAKEEPARPAPRTRERGRSVPYAPAELLGDTVHRETWIRLSWESEPRAISYDVYLGESSEDVNDGVSGTFQGNQNAAFFTVGLPGFGEPAYPAGLVPGKTYYWRVDQVNAKTNSRQKGEVRSFSIAPRTAFEPFPSDGAKSVKQDVTLRWTEGLDARLHTVYFGDDLETVTNAAKGRSQKDKTYSPGPLVPGTTYYWRVDQFDPPTTYKGKVWSFTVDKAAE